MPSKVINHVNDYPTIPHNIFPQINNAPLHRGESQKETTMTKVSIQPFEFEGQQVKVYAKGLAALWRVLYGTKPSAQQLQVAV